jgi:hypothetical protein
MQLLRMNWRSASANYPPLAQQFTEPGCGTGSGVPSELRTPIFLNSRHVALYGEINFVASPTAREITSSVNTATHDFASLYITPGIRVKFRPAPRISPYAVVGADTPTTNKA